MQDKLDFHGVWEPNSGCLLWCGPINDQGYPLISYGGKTHRGNRLVWTDRFGPIAPGLHVLHRCDVTCCVNWRHLFLGTNRDNVADKMRKGRHRCARGERHGNAKLTENWVRLIRQGDRSAASLAAEIGVSETLIYGVRAGKSWRHVA